MSKGKERGLVLLKPINFPLPEFPKGPHCATCGLTLSHWMGCKARDGKPIYGGR